MFTLNLGKLSYVWAIFFQMGWFNHPELHPQVLNHEPRGREPPGTLGVKEIQRMKLKHLHIVILGGGNSNMFFFNLTWGNDPIWRSDIFSNWVGEKPPAKICVWWVLCLGNLRQQKKCTYVKRQAVVRCVFLLWFVLEMWRHFLGHVLSKEPLNAVRQLNASINSMIHRFISDDVHFFNHRFHHIAP